MKTPFLLCILLILFSFQIHSQRSNKPWHNHENYKEDVINAINQSPQLLNPKQYFDIEPSQNETPKTNGITDGIDFVNGINIAWLRFGRDLGMDPEFGTQYRPDMGKLNEIMQAVSEAGGNVIRWWYHTNGSTNPTYDENQMVTINPDFFHEEMINMLDLAAANDLKIQICLWSFDMLKDQWNVDATANKKLLTESDYTDAYINNALLPLVNEVANHPGLYAWEIFNEAEGMTTEYGSHWPGFSERVSITDVQAFINKVAAAIKDAQPEVKVTNGAIGFLTSINDDEKGYVNLFSDERLEAEGNTPGGYLDFYNIHYYNWAGTNGSPFHNDYDPEKGLDKEAIIGEYYPDYTIDVEAPYLATTLMEKGWNGSLLWSWSDRPWDIMRTIIYNAANYTLSTSNNETLKDLKIYPNPSNHNINIKGLTQKNINKIEVINVLGNVIQQHDIEKNTDFISISISNLANGVYFLMANNISIKIVKY